MKKDVKGMTWALSIQIFFICNPACADQITSSDWRSECVGRLQLRLPGEVEIAGYSFNQFAKDLDIRGAQQQFHFVDGQVAGWSKLAYTGILYVSNELAVEEFNILNKKIKQRIQTNQAAAKENVNADGSPLTFAAVNIGTRTGFAWSIAEYYSAFIEIGNRAFFWDVAGGPNRMVRNKGVLTSILNGLSPRQLYTVPEDVGVCLPYAFIKDQGTEHRAIAMTFRPNAHPDITVVLEDTSAVDWGAGKDPDKVAPKRRLADFWGQYEYSRTGKRVDEIWRSPTYRQVRLAGQDGLASFVKITRLNNDLDYGYMAVVRGDNKAKHDTPDIRLFVIREAAHAQAKGIKPIGETAFIEMAEEIAASVQHR